MPQTYEIIGGDHRPHGPVTGEALCQWIREGRASGQSMARVSGSEVWQPLGAFPEFLGPLQGLPWVPVNQPPPKTHPLAITSLVLGIVALLFFPAGVLFGVPAAYFGHRAQSQIQQSSGELGGAGLATAGLVLGYIGTLLGAIALVAFVVFCLFVIQ